MESCHKVTLEIVKFLGVGILNTFIDFGLFNLLIRLSGITSGVWLIPLNSISFLCAATNSYYWNKFWTFKKEGQRTKKEFFCFLAVSAIGWGINTVIVFGGATFIEPRINISDYGWVNLIKVVATLIAMIWNFLGYKFIVFKNSI